VGGPKGIHSQRFGGSFDALCARLRRVRVTCGDWSRVVTDSVTLHPGTPCGVLLDPPYSEGAAGLYAEHDQTLSGRVRTWALEHGDDPNLRIALCGYEGEHAMPTNWQCVPWKAKGGYGNTRADGSNDNGRRERIWFSPHCLGAVRQASLFGRGKADAA
jgi:DNA adenine methylase